jgi:hypothetical protein
VAWGDITGKPTTFAPASHSTNHELAGSDPINVTGLPGVLADPQEPADHVHPIADVTGLQTALDGKAAVTHAHGVNDISDAGALAIEDTISSGLIEAGAVTYAKIQNVTQSRVLGRKTASSGIVEELTGLDLKALIGNVTTGGAGLAPQAPNDSGQFLNGVGNYSTPATLAHQHAAADITSGVLGTARLAATGTPSATTFLRGDQTWATPAAGAAIADVPRFMCPLSWMGAANLTTVSAFATNVTYLLYLGRVGKALTTIDVVNRVGTAAATITWAEVGIFKGTPVANGAATGLTRLGFTNVAATFNTTGIKKTTIALSGHAAEDDLWVAFGSQATTPYQLRSGLAYDIQDGGFQSVAGRLSTIGVSSGTNVAATLAIPWCQAVFV